MRDGKGATAATELQRQKVINRIQSPASLTAVTYPFVSRTLLMQQDEEHFQESQKKQLAADAADKAKRRQEREARR